MAMHTKGPWSYSTEPQPNGCPIIGARGLMVAMLAHTINQDEQKDTAIANARLIAAAPDLLEALQEAKHMFANEYPGHPTTERIFAAIEKATGKPA